MCGVFFRQCAHTSSAPGTASLMLWSVSWNQIQTRLREGNSCAGLIRASEGSNEHSRQAVGVRHKQNACSANSLHNLGRAISEKLEAACQRSVRVHAKKTHQGGRRARYERMRKAHTPWWRLTCRPVRVAAECSDAGTGSCREYCGRVPEPFAASRCNANSNSASGVSATRH